MPSDTITPFDLLEIFHSNLFINGKHVSDIDLSSFDFDEYIKSRNTADFDSDKFFEDWHINLAKCPWKYDLLPIKEIQPNDSMIVFLYPASKIRDTLGRRTDPQFRNGYEWPLLVLSETLTERTSNRLSNALAIAQSLKNLKFLGERSFQFSLLFIIYIHLFRIEKHMARINCSSILSRGSLANCDLSKGKLENINSMSIKEKLAVTLQLNRPLFNLETILQTWELFGQRLAAEDYEDSENDSGIWLYTMLPPFYKSFDEIKSTFENIGEAISEPKIRVTYETSKLAKLIFSLTKDTSITPEKLLNELMDSGVISAYIPDPKVALFRSVGAIWEIVYEGKRTFLRNLKGLSYLQILLKNPGKEYHVLVLQGILDGRLFSEISETLNNFTEDQLDDLGLSRKQLTDPYALVDKKTIQSIKNRREDLDELLQSSEFYNPEKKLEYRDELSTCTLYLQSSTGLGGRERGFTTPEGRLRVNISNLVRNVEKLIGKENENLLIHLKNSIRKGYYFGYFPEKQIPWQF